jgi:hypothetical protein
MREGARAIEEVGWTVSVCIGVDGSLRGVNVAGKQGELQPLSCSLLCTVSLSYHIAADRSDI